MAKEQDVRNYALHLALLVRRCGKKLVLSERYAPKHRLGEFCSWRAVEHAIKKYGDDWLAANPERAP